MKKLPFPLYHGTSTLFTDSIREKGLGGNDSIKELKVLDFLSELEKLADETLTNNENWIYSPKYSISQITSQKTGFQHGQVYLSPSRHTAGRYSQRTYGSEAISSIFEVVDILRSNNIQISNDLINRFQTIMHLETVEKKPILYEISDLPIDFLLMGENHEDVNIQIGKVLKIIEKYGFDKISLHAQQINFRLAKLIPFDWLTELS